MRGRKNGEKKITFRELKNNLAPKPLIREEWSRMNQREKTSRAIQGQSAGTDAGCGAMEPAAEAGRANQDTCRIE